MSKTRSLSLRSANISSHSLRSEPSRRQDIMKYYALFVLIGFVGFSVSEVIQFRNCEYPEGTKLNCTVHEVRVNPCAEASQEKPCRLQRGEDASIAFDYTANFEGNTLESRAYWTNQVIDLPFVGMETDACAKTVCPVQPGQKQTYDIAIPIMKAYPARTYDVKWRMWNTQNQECCFIFGIKLLK
ncbi:GSCOCG00007567001-RA-CDS [Cotesia congregata]|uniref:Similar to MD-2-related lipid-recognition protein (Manduca sexta) n=1 Tax=Cotesia congregata TaxID=51543 RepID=A0A8J2HPK4_COTCN|nr:GSCOCG00007567001-RA-CDS [Cotesia congregata]CAG5101628.1 Similar to MD-2-related lipid-recognition protein (Manduca sexta) [Cotesia congregata]